MINGGNPSVRESWRSTSPSRACLAQPNLDKLVYMVIARWSSLLRRNSKMVMSNLFVPDTGLYKLQLWLEGVEHQGVGQLAAWDNINLCVVDNTVKS